MNPAIRAKLAHYPHREPAEITYPDDVYDGLSIPQVRKLKQLRRVYLRRNEKRPTDPFLNSPRWQRLCHLLIFVRDGKCEVCGKRTERLLVHHQDYKDLEQFKPSRVTVLCNRCHNWLHNKDWIKHYIILCPHCARKIELDLENGVEICNG